MFNQGELFAYEVDPTNFESILSQEGKVSPSLNESDRFNIILLKGKRKKKKKRTNQENWESSHVLRGIWHDAWMFYEKQIFAT